jgi:hypothetical protein
MKYGTAEIYYMYSVYVLTLLHWLFLFNLNYVAQNAPARGSGSASEAGHEPARRAHVGARGADHGGLLRVAFRRRSAASAGGSPIHHHRHRRKHGCRSKRVARPMDGGFLF